MRQSRIHTSQPVQPATTVELTGPAAHYLSRVLRLAKGDPVTLFNGDGKDYSGEITHIEPQRVMVSIKKTKALANESPLKITLVQAICRGERMDNTLQKATELGVHCIQPLLSQRVGVRLDEKRQVKRIKHWQGVVISACEQSGRAVVPEVKMPLSISDWISATDAGPRWVLQPFANNKLSGMSISGDHLSVLVGPEGGFAEEEIEQFLSAGVAAVSLGPRVLRTETAGPAAIAVLQAKTGGL
jgi:16S rRNA (uracil1498-N3)-methyltransferase